MVTANAKVVDRSVIFFLIWALRLAPPALFAFGIDCLSLMDTSSSLAKDMLSNLVCATSIWMCSLAVVDV